MDLKKGLVWVKYCDIREVEASRRAETCHSSESITCWRVRLASADAEASDRILAKPDPKPGRLDGVWTMIMVPTESFESAI